jgi:hypothetical protein
MKFTPQRRVFGLEPPPGPFQFTCETAYGEEHLAGARREDGQACEGHTDGYRNPDHTCTVANRSPA